jgi:hypothetical protein
LLSSLAATLAEKATIPQLRLHLHIRLVVVATNNKLVITLPSS